MLTQCHIDTAALASNIRALRAHVGDGALLAPTVKSNAYGHGLALASRTFLDAGANWLCAHAFYEAQRLRDAGIEAPIYILGYTAPEEIEAAMALNCDMVVWDSASLKKAAEVARRTGLEARFHLKLETGNNRQGLREEAALALAKDIAATPGVSLVGVASHFANIEDTTDHSYAQAQMTRFEAFCARLEALGVPIPLRHISNSAASILWPGRCQDMVRAGVASYGMWPSKETMVAAMLAGHGGVELTPALTWTCRIAQMKSVPAGEYVGYGCTFRTTHDTRLAILPVGYYDGYPRALSNIAHVLIEGRRAPIRGRVCMNVTMVDITDIPEATMDSDVILLGSSGDERISAEQLADWASTINYEITTRIHEQIPRIAR